MRSYAPVEFSALGLNMTVHTSPLSGARIVDPCSLRDGSTFTRRTYA
jgi:hypothetical protein